MSSQDVKLEIAELTSALNNKYDRTDFLYSDITNIDLDNVTIPGNYISHSYSKSLHYPYFVSDDIIEEDCILKVNTDTSNDLIIQELEIGKYSSFRRIYKDGSWHGWVQTSGISINEVMLEDEELYTCLYVTKDGNDTNDGFTRNTSLLTIEEAIRRSRLNTQHTTNGGFIIYVGSGEWGSLLLDRNSQLIEIQNYDDELPKFNQIIIRDCGVVTIRNIQADKIDAAYGSFVRIYGGRYNLLNVRLFGKLLLFDTIQVIEPEFQEMAPQFIYSYQNGEVFFREVTIDIPKEIHYETAFMAVLEGSTIGFKNLNDVQYINPENLHANYCLYVSESGKINPDRTISSGKLAESFPISYTNFLYIAKNGSIGNNNAVLYYQPNSTIRSDSDTDLWLNSYVDVDPETGETSKTRYSSWIIFPNTFDRSHSHINSKSLGYFSYEKNKNTSSSIGIYAHKAIGRSSGQTSIKCGWTLDSNNELVPFANCPAYKGDGTISNILTVADAPVYIVEMGGDNNAWYKKYSNGFIEQGGIASSISTGNTITFNIAFVNSPFVMAYRPDGASYPDTTLKLSSVPYSITNSKFNISVGGNGNKIIWYACGY